MEGVTRRGKGGSSSCPASLTTPSAVPERAEKSGQSLTRVPYKDTFWKGTTRTRPRKGQPSQREASGACGSERGAKLEGPGPLLSLSPFLGNGTLNKLAGIDFRQLSLGHKLNENQSGEVLFPAPLPCPLPAQMGRGLPRPCLSQLDWVT